MVIFKQGETNKTRNQKMMMTAILMSNKQVDDWHVLVMMVMVIVLTLVMTMIMTMMTTVTMMMMTASQTCNNWVDQCYVLGFSRNFSDAALQTALITVCYNTIRVQKNTDSVVQSWKVMDRTVHKSTALITVTSCTSMDCTVVWYRKPILLLYRWFPLFQMSN